MAHDDIHTDMHLNRRTEEPQKRTARQAIFWETLETVWNRNRDLSAAEAQTLADAAVAEARADRSCDPTA